jgi:hypothetical protein
MIRFISTQNSGTQMKVAIAFRTALLAAVFALASCVKAVPPAEAVLSFTPAQACASAISATGATALTPQKPAGQFAQSVNINAASPCYVDANGASAAYAIFALPMADAASVNAGAVLEPRRVLAPQVMTLDASLNPVRSFAADDFHHRGHSYSVLFRPTAAERYVVVATNTALVGNRFSYVSVDPSTVSPPARLAPNTTAETYRERLGAAYSYEGQAFARVYFNAPAAATP